MTLEVRDSSGQNPRLASDGLGPHLIVGCRTEFND